MNRRTPILLALLAFAACEEPVASPTIVPPDSQPLLRVLVEPSGAFLEGIGADMSFTAQVDSGGVTTAAPGATWTVSNPAVASIDGDGRVTALRGGQVAVTARVGQREGRAVVTIREPSAGGRYEWRLASAQTNATLAVGGTAAGDVWLVSRSSEAPAARGSANTLRYDGGTLQPAGAAIPGVELSAVWVSGSEAIAVGSVPNKWAGRAFRYDGAGWQPMQLPSSVGSLLDVWGSAPDEVWAVSNLSQILHYDGVHWRIVVDHPPDDIRVGPAAIWGAGPEEVFVLLSPNRVLHYDGGPPSQWTEIGPEQEGIYRSLWGSSPDDLFLVGSGGGSTRALHFDGEGWSTVPALDGVPGRFEVVGGSGPEDVYVGGGGGIHGSPESLFHFDGTSWQEVERAAREEYGLVDSWTAPTGEVYLSGHRGLLVRAEAGEISEIHHADTPYLHDVWGASEANVFAVGSAGTILHHDGDGWSTVESGTDRDLFTIWGTGPETVFAGGADGTVLHFDGAWSQFPPAGTGDVFAVWGLAEDDLFAAVADPHDERGRILHFDGTAWTPTPVAPPEDKDVSFSTDIRAFWGFAPDDVLAAGRVWWRECEGCSLQLRDAVLRWDGEAWSTVWTGTSHDNHFADIWASSPTDIWVIGRYGPNPYAVRYDGSQWSEVSPQVPAYTYPPLTAVWGTGPEDIYVGGLDGLLLHFDGAGWTEFQAPVEETVGGIWGTASGTAWAVTGARFPPTGGGILRGIRD